MADRKISDLTALTTPASGDYLPIVDISESAAASKNKRITIEELMRGAPDGTAAAPSIAFESDPNTGIYSPGADQVAISTNGTGRLFVGSDGSVGIGGSNLATVPLLVQDTGNGVVIQNTASGNYAIGLLAGTGSQDAYVYQRASAPLIFGTSNTERMRLDSTGRLGLGTSSPGGRLNVLQDATANTTPAIRITGSAGDPTNYFLDVVPIVSGSTVDYRWDLKSISTNTALLYLSGAGHVGIGTSSPRFALSIGSAVAVSTATPDTLDLGATFSPTPGANPKLRVYEDAISPYGFGVTYSQLEYICPTSASHVFFTAGTEKARIDSSGRLLVGTSSARSNVAGFIPHLQLEGLGVSASSVSLTNNAADSAGCYILLTKTRGTSIGSNTIVQNGDALGGLYFVGADGVDTQQAAAYIQGEVDGTPGADDMPGRLVFSVTADGSASPTEALRISSNRAITVSDGGNVVLGTTTGTKIGTATTQKLGFYDATPVVQPTAVADATDAATVITQLNALLTRMRNLGLIAT